MLFASLVADCTLLVGIVAVVGWRRFDLPLRIVAHHAVIPAFQFVADLWGQGHDLSGRFLEPHRRVTGVTLARQVVLRRFVAARAIGRELSALGVAASTVGVGVGAVRILNTVSESVPAV